ncbi:MAG: ABC exporter membrane fusion protein [Symploca sp. SIO3C6]|uniref:ABC exporter membrane fusion protein n=1 Tax=Symploca sp. SIO1C4 TaxID=2607765 RepID=A0A6B3NGW2_9CYAN|nr:ABC exporter membrane fusion protein [Symploca sp. SIO3C6]NER30900.1 ABC exporter membrane fusion protein [Symploca sp. SIO1C4]
MQDATAAKSSKPFILPVSALLTIAILIVGGITAYSLRQSSQTRVASNSAPSVPEIKTVTALGRLEPSGEVIQVSAPSSIQGDRLKELLVTEGDNVVKGQIMAILDTHDRAWAALKQAEEQVRVAQANLAQVKAGAKTGEIEAQKAAIARIKAERSNDIAAQSATVARLEAELKNAHIEYQRYEKLHTEGAISASQRDSRQLTFETAQRQLEQAQANLQRIEIAQQEQIREAQATLERIAEVRPVDVEVAAAEVRNAQAAVATTRAELDLTYIKAPQAGQILDVLTRPGEVISSDGIARIGQTSQMYVVAEVYESDIGKIKVGQQVKVTSNAVSGELHGTVEQIGLEVQRQEVINTDPAANIDAKIIEVRVKLDQQSTQKVAGLTNLLVKVAITL